MSRRDINIRAFTGMNNLKQHGRFWADPEHGVVEPRIVLNADANISGQLEMREGMGLHTALPNAHSLWAGRTCMLCVAEGILYRIEHGEATAVHDLSGNQPVSFEEVDGRVYVSNEHNTGIFDPRTNTWNPWGIMPPGATPTLTVCGGGLPAGIYHVTMTNFDDGELSGNGPASQIELQETGGIEILNRPAGAVVWVTDANGAIFYYAGQTDRIIDLPSFEPLPSFMCMPPPSMSLITFFFGRMWGADGDRLVYSEPYQPGWFKPTTNYFGMDSEITIIAKVPTGLFVGTRKSTRFLQGTIPEEMAEMDAGAPSIPGTLAYANNLPDLGDQMAKPTKGYVDVPVWRTTEGIVVGNASGRLFNLTKDSLRMGAPSRGASLYRTSAGSFQFITTAPLSQDGGDPLTNKIFKASKPTTSAAGFLDAAEVEVRRGGKLI